MGGRIRRRVYVLVMAFVTAAGMVVSVEIFARIVERLGGPGSFRFRQFDPLLGVSLVAGRQGVHRRCYDGYVYVNRHGMRDRERSQEKPADVFRIAVFGDSMIEAVHVKPEETATRMLEEKLNAGSSGQRFEVLNFAVGGYSTYQEYLRYQRDGRQFGSDLVVVFFIGNDLQANLADTAAAVGNLYPAPYLRKVGERYVPVAPEEPALASTVAWLMDRSAAFFFAYKAAEWFRRVPEFPLPAWARATHPAYRYLDSGDPVAIRSWEVTEYILGQFVEAVRRDGARFALVHMGYDVGSEPWQRPIPAHVSVPETFDPQFASKWFRRFGERRKIVTYDLGADLAAYVRQRGLAQPYLSFPCDPHFNPEGQAVIADLLYKALVGSGAVELRRTAVASER